MKTLKNFFRSPFGLAGTVMFLLVVVSAVFAPSIAPMIRMQVSMLHRGYSGFSQCGTYPGTDDAVKMFQPDSLRRRISLTVGFFAAFMAVSLELRSGSSPVFLVVRLAIS